MTLENHWHLIPQIEKEITDLKLDCIVLGLGPTAHLFPWIDRKVIGNIRVFGAHDVWRLWPVDDLLIMDPPQEPRLQPGTVAHDWVLKARPKRVWFFAENFLHWEPYFHRPLLSVSTQLRMLVWQRGPDGNRIPQEVWPKAPILEADPIHTVHISPAAATTLAWKEGCRRIGVLGVDCRDPRHPSFGMHHDLEVFFGTIAAQAKEKDGLIANLSPISALTKWRAMHA